MFCRENNLTTRRRCAWLARWAPPTPASLGLVSAKTALLCREPPVCLVYCHPPLCPSAPFRPLCPFSPVFPHSALFFLSSFLIHRRRNHRNLSRTTRIHQLYATPIPKSAHYVLIQNYTINNKHFNRRNELLMKAYRVRHACRLSLGAISRPPCRALSETPCSGLRAA